MKTRYTQGKYDGIEISANDVEWEAFARALDRGTGELDCEPVNNPSPYEHASELICISLHPGRKVRFTILEDGSMAVEGDEELLRKLSRTASIFGHDFESGHHIHVEYQGDDHFIASDSMPVVFAHEGSGG